MQCLRQHLPDSICALPMPSITQQACEISIQVLSPWPHGAPESQFSIAQGSGITDCLATALASAWITVRSALGGHHQLCLGVTWQPSSNLKRFCLSNKGALPPLMQVSGQGDIPLKACWLPQRSGQGLQTCLVHLWLIRPKKTPSCR